MKKEIFVKDGYLVYEQYHALNNDFTFGRYFITPAKYKEMEAFSVSPDDIIISCSGVYLGKLAIIPHNAKKGIINQALLKITLDPNKMNNNFFVFLFTRDSFKRNFFGDVRGSGIPNFPPISEFKKFDFIYPPIELQNTFNRIVNQINKIKEVFFTHKDSLKELYNSLSTKALKGELEINEQAFIEGTIKVQPAITGEVIAIDKINRELEEFHKSQQHTGAPIEIDNTIRQLEAELKIKGEIPFWDEYVKYRIVKSKFKEPFTFELLWDEITKFPFETMPSYDKMSDILFKWLKEENPFIKQIYNENTKQIELLVNETAKA